MGWSNKDKASGRDYKKEYKAYQGSPEQIKKRSQRNKARRKLEKEGRVSKNDGKDVDHKKGVTKGNGKANLRVQSKSANRSFKRTSSGKVKKY
jgi:hypothetical protein